LGCCFIVAFFLAYFGIAAATLRVITDWVAKIYLPFRDAARIAIIIVVANMLFFWSVMALVSIAIPIIHDSLYPRLIVGYICGMAAMFIVDTVIFAKIIKYPSSRQPIGFKKGALLAALTVAIYLATQLLSNGFIYLISNPPTPPTTAP